MSIFTSIYIERYSVSMVKSTSNKGTKQAVRMLLVVVAIVVGLVALIIVPQTLYDNHENYRDRPLAEGYEYVGRYNRNTCLIRYIELKAICHIAMPVEVYFYATDIPPKDFARSFPGWEFWEVEHKESEVYHGNKKGSRTTVDNYLMRNNNSQELFDYKAYPDHTVVADTASLKHTGKRYLVSIYRESYEELVNTSTGEN